MLNPSVMFHDGVRVFCLFLWDRLLSLTVLREALFVGTLIKAGVNVNLSEVLRGLKKG